MASEPLDPSSWRLRTSMPRTNHIVPPRSHLLALPPQQPPPLASTPPFELRPPSQIPPMQPSVVHTTSPPTPNLALTLAPTVANIRKRQYRFSVGADIGLLRLVAKHNPYGAPHGGRLQKWQTIAETLRISGINVDFRRARDRTALLIEQWRKQEFSLLRRSGSGNQHDQAEKERLLDIVSNMEHAAKPRDNLSDWRPRDASSRIATPTHNVLLSDAARTSDSPDNNSQCVAVNASNGENEHTNPSPLPPSADVNVSTASRPVSLAHPFSTPLAPPVVTVPPVGSNMQSVSPPNSNTASRHAALPPLEPQRDVLMTSETAALQHGCAQPLPKSNDVKRLAHIKSSYLSAPAAIPSADEAKRTCDSFFTPGSTALCSLRARGASHAVDTAATVGCNVLSNAAPRAAISNQNIQLEAPTCEQGRSELHAAAGSSSHVHVCSHFSKLERMLQQMLQTLQKKVELDERRLEWEKHCEQKRQQMYRERLDREFRDRELEREERRQKDVGHKEERERLLARMARGRAHAMSDGDHPE